MLVFDHNLRFIMDICDRVCVMARGEMIVGGTPVDVAAEGAGRELVREPRPGSIRRTRRVEKGRTVLFQHPARALKVVPRLKPR